MVVRIYRALVDGSLLEVRTQRAAIFAMAKDRAGAEVQMLQQFPQLAGNLSINDIMEVNDLHVEALPDMEG